MIGQLLTEFDASQSVGHCVWVPKRQGVHDRRKSREKLWRLDVHVVCRTSIYYLVWHRCVLPINTYYKKCYSFICCWYFELFLLLFNCRTMNVTKCLASGFSGLLYFQRIICSTMSYWYCGLYHPLYIHFIRLRNVQMYEKTPLLQYTYYCLDANVVLRKPYVWIQNVIANNRK